MNETSVVSTAPLGGLYSGRILRAVVQSLDVQDEVLTNRTARRFFSGQHVDEHNRNQIFEALGQALITRGLAPETLEDLPETLPMASRGGNDVDDGLRGMGPADGPHPSQFRAGRRRRERPWPSSCGSSWRTLRLRLFALVYLDLEDPPGSEPPACGCWRTALGTSSGSACARSGADQIPSGCQIWECRVPPWTTGWTARAGPVLKTSPPWPGNWPQGNAAAMRRRCRGPGAVSEPSDLPRRHGGPDGCRYWPGQAHRADHKAGSFRKGVVAVAGAPPNPGGQSPGDCAQPDHARVPRGGLPQACFRGWQTGSRTLIGVGTCSQPSGSGIPPSRRWP